MAFGNGSNLKTFVRLNECRLNKLFLKANKESLAGGWCYPDFASNTSIFQPIRCVVPTRLTNQIVVVDSGRGSQIRTSLISGGKPKQSTLFFQILGR